MKKIICFILSLLILPSIFIFTGCEKKEKRTMLEFYSNYLAIANSSDYLNKQPLPERLNASATILKVGFVYSAELQIKINNNAKFEPIDQFYNNMLDDALGPMYLYGNLLNRTEVNDDDKATLYKQLDILKANYIEIANRLGDLERTQNDGTAEQNLIKLYSSYENAISTGTNISSKVSSIYFKDVMLKPNVNYYEINEANVNLSDLAIRTFNRLVFYKSVYVDIYLQTQIIGYDVPTKIVNNNFYGQYVPYNSLCTTVYNDTISTDITSYRTSLVELGKTLYLIQNSFDHEYQKYKKATKEIIYSKVNENSSITAIGYKHFIDSFCNVGGIAYASFNALSGILNICY